MAFPLGPLPLSSPPRLWLWTTPTEQFMLSLILIALLATHALALPKWHDLSRNSVPMPDSQTWYQHSDHPVHALFKRTQDDGADIDIYAPVGSPEWSTGFPPPGLTLPPPSTMPVAWVNALNSAVAAGKIPNIPMSNNTPGTNPVYPNGLSPTSSEICSGTYGCRIAGDIWDAPDGVFASAFDDGPTPSTPALVEFLQSNNETTTHFMIGSNILYYPSQFSTAFNAGHDIADHTFTHPYLTTKNNLDIVGELGWTMLLIANSTGGRLPKFWRPPYGDTDVRVSAIAREVFSLTAVVWNHDTADWEQNSTAPIENSLRQFLSSSPKSPGLIVLEHELSDITVTGFMISYNMIKANGWKFQSLAQAIGGGASYLNAQNSSTDNVVPEPIVSSVSFSSSSTTSPSGTPTSEASMTNLTTNTPSPQQASGTSCQSSTTLFLMTFFSLAILLCS